MRATSFFFVSAVVASSFLAACASSDNRDGSGSSTSELNTTRLELTCTSGAQTFDVAPTAAGTLEGKLTRYGTSSLFDCVASSDAPDAGAVVTCQERTVPPQPPSRVVISKDGAVFSATAQIDGVGPVSFTCAEPPPPPATPAYVDVEPLIAQKCGSCHRMTFASLAKVKARRSAMIAKLAAGQMPKGQPTWFQSSDGEKLLDFLRNSPELN